MVLGVGGEIAREEMEAESQESETASAFDTQRLAEVSYRCRVTLSVGRDEDMQSNLQPTNKLDGG